MVLIIEILVFVGILCLVHSRMSLRHGCRSGSCDARRVSDVRQVELALELYYAAHLQYPEASTSGLAALATEGFLNMSAFPKDPKTSNPYCYAVGADTSLIKGKQNIYYHIGTKLENKDSDILNQDMDDNSQNIKTITWTWNQSPDCGTNPANSNFDGTDSKKSPIYDRGIFPK